MEKRIEYIRDTIRRREVVNRKREKEETRGTT